MSGSPSAASTVLRVVVPALRIVVRHRADERELHVRVPRAHEPPGLDHAERVLPRVEAGDLGDQRALDVDPELVDDVRGVLGREGHVLRGERVDRRRPDVRGRHRHRRCGTYCAPVEDRRVVARRATARGTRAPPGSASRGRCGSARSSGSPPDRASSSIAAGCGSWTITKSYSPVERLGVQPVVLAEDALLLVASAPASRPGARCGSPS